MAPLLAATTAHPFLPENERMHGRGSAKTIEFAGVFAGFRLYLNDRRLYRLDQARGEVPVRLGNPAFNLLRLLVEQEGQPVSKEELKSAAWPQDKKGNLDDNLRVEIGNLRSSLGENARNSYIRLEPKSGGYRYVPPTIPISSDNSSDRRDVDKGQVSTNTLPNSTLLLAVVKAATEELTALTEQQQQIINALQIQLDISEQALNTIFNVLDEKEVPVDQLWDKLTESAEAIKKALRLATAGSRAWRTLNFTGPTPHELQIADSRRMVNNAVASGQLDRADEFLEQLQNLQDAELGSDHPFGLELDRASTSEQRGHLAIARLRYHDAERHFAEAAKWLKEAIAASRVHMEKFPGARAAIQRDLGTALVMLGGLESGTARLEEAVAAFRAVLEEYTREREKTPYVGVVEGLQNEEAQTQYELANALRALGE
jgi:DNA-binding winged helix-turn-helix (wHTH) protein